MSMQRRQAQASAIMRIAGDGLDFMARSAYYHRMSAIPFDTLALARKLRDEAHFSPEQAEGTARALAEVLGEQVATRADIESLRHDMQSGFRDNEQRLTIRLGTMIAAGVAFLSAIKFFGH